MKKIEFAKGLALPVDAATQTIAFIARKGAGKSYAGGKLVEGLHEHEAQFVVIDPVGNWWGLRLAADGKANGIDIPVLGGLRGDIPLNADSGKLIADAVCDTGRSFVLDVSQFSLGERKRFVTAFGEQLWLKQKGLRDPQPIHVVLEEAQLFLPQAFQSDDARMVGIWTEIVRLGRNKGIGVSLITQRPQSVSKEALTQVECLVVLQVNGVPEKKALKEWIVEKGLETNLLEELPFLKQGTAYIWSPQWLEHFGKHEILPKWTFDAGMTPKVGMKRVQADLKPIDLEGLKAQMADTVKKAEENDPGALKRRIRELEDRVVKSEFKLKVSDPAKQVEVPTITEKDFNRLEAGLKKVDSIVIRLMATGQPLTELLEAFKRRLAVEDPYRPRYASKIHTFQVQKAPLRERLAQPSVQASVKVARERLDNEGQKIGKGAREMLKALATREPTPLTKVQMGALAGLSSNSGTFSTYLSQLRTSGFIEESNGLVQLTSAGRSYLGDDVPDAPSSTQGLVDLWKSKFPKKVGEMLQELVERHPNSVGKQELGDIVGITHTSGTYSTYLSRLRSNGLVETQGSEIKASESLFI